MGMKKASLSISKKYYLKDRKVWMNPSMNSMNQMGSMNSMNQMNSMSSMMRMNMDEGPLIHVHSHHRTH